MPLHFAEGGILNRMMTTRIEHREKVLPLSVAENAVRGTFWGSRSPYGNRRAEIKRFVKSATCSGHMSALFNTPRTSARDRLLLLSQPIEREPCEGDGLVSVLFALLIEATNRAIRQYREARVRCRTAMEFATGAPCLAVVVA